MSGDLIINNRLGIRRCFRLRNTPFLMGIVVTAFLLVAVEPRKAWAGPPFRTDDPEPVAYKHWEFYLAHTYDKDKDGVSGTAPHLELNYGVAPNLHLHITAPFAYDRPQEGPNAYGFGDLELGVKYRFVQEGENIPMIGIFPILELPTGNQNKALGNGDPQLFLPIWFQKAWGPWQSYGGGGYWLNGGSRNKNYWYAGWQIQREIAKWLTLGAEIFYTTPPTVGGEHQVGYNIGGFLNFTENHHIIFSAGSDIHGPNVSRYYIAYLLTWGPPEKKNGNNKK
jgi:hypothetical protein